MTVYITKWTCAAGNWSFGVAWDDRTDNETHVVAMVEAYAYGIAKFNPHCGICGGAIWPCTEPTGYTDLATAEPEFMRLQEEQLALRRHLDNLGLTVEKMVEPLPNQDELLDQFFRNQSLKERRN